MKRLLASILLCIAAASSFATTYVRVEKDGTKTYSDRPMPGGQPIEIQSAQTYSAPPSAGTASDVPKEQQLLNPESVALGVSLSPALRGGDVVDLRLDGAPVGPENTVNFVVKPVFRGAHTVSVSVKDRYGRSLCEASSTFHVFQPNLNSPTRRPPPRPRS
jgi:hypothetical protein